MSLMWLEVIFDVVNVVGGHLDMVNVVEGYL